MKKCRALLYLLIYSSKRLIRDKRSILLQINSKNVQIESFVTLVEMLFYKSSIIVTKIVTHIHLGDYGAVSKTLFSRPRVQSPAAVTWQNDSIKHNFALACKRKPFLLMFKGLQYFVFGINRHKLNIIKNIDGSVLEFAKLYFRPLQQEILYSPVSMCIL